MSTRIVYLVFGRTGEYSDANEWRVRAYEDEGEAEHCVRRCTELAAAVFEVRDGQYDDVGTPAHTWWTKALEAAKSEDDSIQCDYTGTTYWLEKLTLRSAP